MAEELKEQIHNPATRRVDSEADASLEKEFDILAKQWREETAHLSVIFRKAMHPAYQRIIGMGEKAIPLILREMQERGGYWFWALNAITGEDPAQPSASYKEAVRTWLNWGKEHGHI